MVALLPLFPLLSCFRLMQPDGGSLEPDATTDGYWYVKTADDHELLGGPRQEALPLQSCYFCASLLKASLFNLCLYSDIVASADSCVSSYVFEPSRPLACNIKLVLFYLCLELCCDIFP